MAQELVTLANNPNIAKNLTDAFPHPYTLNDAITFINICIENDGKTQLCRAICMDDKVIGSVGVFFRTDVYRKSAELGYWLGEPYWGQGIMPKAVRMLCEQVFDEFDIIRIEARLFDFNQASCRVLEKAGFIREARLKNTVVKYGQVYDSILYALFNHN